MHIAGWIPKATDKHAEYVIPIVFPRQQWLNLCASMLRYTYIACLVQIPSTKIPTYCPPGASEFFMLSDSIVFSEDH